MGKTGSNGLIKAFGLFYGYLDPCKIKKGFDKSQILFIIKL
jgi:hypothetical protein